MLPPQPSRRRFLQSGAAAISLAALADFPVHANRSPLEAMDIGTRRELFVDRSLIEKLQGDVRQRLQHPIPREVVIRHDEDWEGTGCGYHSVFHDGDRYRMYYKAWHLDPQQGKLLTNRHPLYCCYAESDDGIQWRKPNLGLYEHAGSTQNNITMASGRVGALNVDAGHPAVFLDENPHCAEDAKYKAIFRSSKPNGLHPFQSADGWRWRPMTDAPILSGLGAFDSQNLAFWDPNLGKYRAYWRIFTSTKAHPQSYRAIRTAISGDLIHWDQVKDLTYVDSPVAQLYTNVVKPYHRAPHWLLGFPARYIDRGWSESMKSLPDLENREVRASSTRRYGTAITDSLFMASRDGVKFQRWNESFLRPGVQRPGTWHYGAQYLAWHLVETQSTLPGAAPELSLYATESYWHGKGSAVRRYSLRLDGFVCLHGGAKGGTVRTPPLLFAGNQLSLNAATSAAGSIRVALLDSEDKPYPGFSLDDAEVLFGDSIDMRVGWKDQPEVGSLQGKPVKLQLEIKDGDVYSFQFQKN